MYNKKVNKVAHSVDYVGLQLWGFISFLIPKGPSSKIALEYNVRSDRGRSLYKVRLSVRVSPPSACIHFRSTRLLINYFPVAKLHFPYYSLHSLARIKHMFTCGGKIRQVGYFTVPLPNNNIHN